MKKFLATLFLFLLSHCGFSQYGHGFKAMVLPSHGEIGSFVTGRLGYMPLDFLMFGGFYSSPIVSELHTLSLFGPHIEGSLDLGPARIVPNISYDFNSMMLIYGIELRMKLLPYYFVGVGVSMIQNIPSMRISLGIMKFKYTKRPPKEHFKMNKSYRINKRRWNNCLLPFRKK